jgi:hypothetical protein
MNDYPNPWLGVPSVPPYFLSYDSARIQAFNRTHPNEMYALQEKVLPEPFIGNTKAQIVLLNLNPGFDDHDPEDHARSEFQALLRNNYSQSPLDYPFYFLDPQFDSGGRRWWERKLGCLLGIVERTQLARALLCVEYFPYHSRRFRHGSLELPSQEFGFDLVRSAIKRKALVLFMRGRKMWLERIPELADYENKFALNSPQNVVISRGNCPADWFDRTLANVRTS